MSLDEFETQVAEQVRQLALLPPSERRAVLDAWLRTLSKRHRRLAASCATLELLTLTSGVPAQSSAEQSPTTASPGARAAGNAAEAPANPVAAVLQHLARWRFWTTPWGVLVGLVILGGAIFGGAYLAKLGEDAAAYRPQPNASAAGEASTLSECERWLREFAPTLDLADVAQRARATRTAGEAYRALLPVELAISGEWERVPASRHAEFRTMSDAVLRQLDSMIGELGPFDVDADYIIPMGLVGGLPREVAESSSRDPSIPGNRALRAFEQGTKLELRLMGVQSMDPYIEAKNLRVVGRFGGTMSRSLCLTSVTFAAR